MQVDSQSKIASIMSNRIEELYVHLKKQLIANQSNPFKKRFVIVPDSFVKSYVQCRLATEKGKVAMGIEILLPKQAIEQIVAFSTVNNPLSFSSYLDLLVAVTRVIRERPVEIEQALSFWRISDKEKKSPDFVLKELQLARQIVHILVLDGWYGLKVKEQKFAAWRLQIAEVVSRQESIRLLTREPHFVEISKDLHGMMPDEILLFGISTLCEAYHRFFCRISEAVPVGYFILSPCMLFWSDICSDREVQKLREVFQEKLVTQVKQEAFCDLVMDRCLLLANSGKIGREFSALLEETVNHSEESYVTHDWALNDPLFSKTLRTQGLSEQKEMTSSITLLGILHNSLLCLVGKSSQKIQLASSDNSIQVHAAPSLLREVQVLYERLIDYTNALQRPLLLGEIMVLTPDIELYRPYIERVFRENSAVPYQIFGSKRLESHSLFSFFWQVLELPGTDWSADVLFDLFGCRAIRRKFGLASEDLSGVYACMSAGVFQGSKTLSSFIDRMVFLWTSSTGKRGDFELDSSLGTALGICIHIIRSLQAAFEPFVFQEDRSLETWIGFFESLFTDYFELNLKDQKEQKEWNLLRQAFSMVKKCSVRHSKGLFSFFAVKEFFKEAFEEVLAKEETVIQVPLVFSSIGKSGAFAAEMTCLIGMNEGLFPRQDKKILITNGFSWVGKGNISTAAIDKYQFIKAVLATRKVLYMSYQSYSYQEKSPLEPSSSIVDLLQTLDDCCMIGEDRPSVKSVFSHRLDSRFVVSRGKQVASPGIALEPILKKDLHSETITVTYLTQVAKSPLRPYFQQRVSLYLAEGKCKRLNDPFAGIETMTLSLIKKKAFRLPIEQARALFESETKGMPEVIKLASISLFTDEITQLQRSAREFGIAYEQAIKIELLANCSEVQEVAPGHWKVPAISVPTNEGKRVQIVGVLDDLYSQGHLFFGSQSEETLVRHWSKILLTSCLAKTFDLPLQNDYYFLKDGKKRAGTIKDPVEALNRYVNYAIDCKTEISCLYPEWVPKLLTLDSPPKESRESNDLYLNFFLSRISEEALFDQWPLWRARAIGLFADLGDN